MTKLPARSRQEGASLLIVLVVLTVMLLAGFTMARYAEVGTLAAGNMAFKEGSIQASEAGVNTAFEQLTTQLPSEDQNYGSWYRATEIAERTDGGLPDVSWNDMPEVDMQVSSYDVRYVVERMCTTGTTTSDPRQCLVKQVPQLNSSKDDGEEPLDPPAATQFRTTVRVVGPKGTTTFVQSLMTKG